MTARRGEIVCIAGIDGNGQSELVYALTGLEKASGGKITLCSKDITHASIRQRSFAGMSHIPEDRHKHGLVLDYTLEQNLVSAALLSSRSSSTAASSALTRCANTPISSLRNTTSAPARGR